MRQKKFPVVMAVVTCLLLLLVLVALCIGRYSISRGGGASLPLPWD